jgi:MFS family permease
VPSYARDALGISTQLIGLLLFANATTVVIAQVPISKFAEGRRRVVMMALAAAIFAVACLLIFSAQFAIAAYPTLVVAAIAIGLGECLHSTALSPLVADLAPLGVRGRYMAAIGLSQWVGLALAPTIGTPLLSVSPAAALLSAAAVAVAAGGSMLTLEAKLPDTARLTPRAAQR